MASTNYSITLNRIAGDAFPTDRSTIICFSTVSIGGSCDMDNVNSINITTKSLTTGTVNFTTGAGETDYYVNFNQMQQDSMFTVTVEQR